MNAKTLLTAGGFFVGICAALVVYSETPDAPPAPPPPVQTAAPAPAVTATPVAAPSASDVAKGGSDATKGHSDAAGGAAPQPHVVQAAVSTGLTPATAEEERQYCPADWSLFPAPGRLSADAIQKMPRPDLQADQALLPPEFAHMPTANAGTIAGGGINFALPGGSYFNVDGRHLIGVHTLTLRDSGAASFINVLAPGLATIPGGNLVLTDQGNDIVFLDGCLRWEKPVETEHDGSKYLRYTAADQEGNIASIDLSAGLDVRLLPPQRVGAWAAIANKSGSSR
jgi:hypothetical protein